jgi:outer membrane biosynthesis protein TonB
MKRIIVSFALAFAIIASAVSATSARTLDLYALTVDKSTVDNSTIDKPTVDNPTIILPSIDRSLVDDMPEVMMAPSDMAELKRLMRYPTQGLNMQQEGRFDVIAYIDNDGTIKAVNFELKGNSTSENMRYLIIAALETVSKYRFNEAYNGMAVRIPFNFYLMR